MVLEKTPEGFLNSKETKQVNLKGNQPRILMGRTDVEVETPVLWSSNVNNWLIGKVPGAERLKAERKEAVRGWDGWMVSLMQWAWTRANFGRWWGTGKPGVLQSMRLQRVRHDWVTEQQRDNKDHKAEHVYFVTLYIIVCPYFWWWWWWFSH